jgi:tetratricopeptide (TPR) repeat protein
MMYITKKVKTDSIFEHACQKSPYGGFPHRVSLNAFLVFYVSLFFFCLLTSSLSAQIPSVQLSPTDLLMPYFERSLPNVNSPTVQTQDTEAGPTDLLMPFLEQALRYENTAAVQMHYANIGSIPREESPVESLKAERQTGDTEAANFAVEANQELPRTLSAVPAVHRIPPQGVPRRTYGGINNPLGRKLWRAGIGFYKDQNDKSGKSELKRLIEQIRAFETKPAEHQSESVFAIEPIVPAVEPNKTQSDVEPTEETRKKTIESELPYKPVTDQTLQMLANFSQDPNQVENPFGLGEVLYFSGRLREAVPFYRQAFNRMDKDKAGEEQNRAWILFQLGNCLRDYDMPAAKKMYVRLITEYPESTWVDLAKVWEKLIDLYLKEKPDILLNERQL